jgi:hypothetical protein
MAFDPGRVRDVAALAFGGEPQVVPAHGPGEPAFAMLTCAEAPAAGLASHSTLTLHEAPNVVDGSSRPVELAGVAPASAPAFRDALASAAASIVGDGWLAAPGVVYADLLAPYGLSPELPHVLLVRPFVWPELTSVALRDGPVVHWLLAVAISEPERRLLRDSGDAALLAQLGRQRVPYWDLGRASAV